MKTNSIIMSTLLCISSASAMETNFYQQISSQATARITQMQSPLYHAHVPLMQASGQTYTYPDGSLRFQLVLGCVMKKKHRSIASMPTQSPRVVNIPSTIRVFKYSPIGQTVYINSQTGQLFELPLRYADSAQFDFQ